MNEEDLEEEDLEDEDFDEEDEDLEEDSEDEDEDEEDDEGRESEDDDMRFEWADRMTQRYHAYISPRLMAEIEQDPAGFWRQAYRTVFVEREMGMRHYLALVTPL